MGSWRTRVPTPGMARRPLVVAAVVAASLCGASAAAASAGAPIVLSASGANPQVAVDSAGTAHIVWDGTGLEAGNLEYCEIPVGGTACADGQSFPTYDEADARVLLGPSPDEVVLLDTGAGAGATAVNVWVSMDGGLTFGSGPNGSAGVVGGGFTTQGGTDADRFDDDQLPVFGPGGFSVSWMDGDGYFESFPVNTGPAVDSGLPSSTIQDTQLFSDCGYPDPDSIALLNAGTLVAQCIDSPSGTVHYRVATGQGDIDDASTGSWGPDQSVSGDSSAVGAWLAGGSRGVYLLYNAPDGGADVRQLVNGTFGAPVQIASHTYVEGFDEDPTGNLFAITQDTSQGASGKQQRVFTSPDGVHWTEVALDLSGVLADNANAEAEISGCAAAGGTSTGSGFVVFNSVSSSAAGTIYAESFGSSPCGAFQGSSSCPTHLTIGLAQMTATSGCFAAIGGGSYTTDSPVELNGMTIDPTGGAGGNVRHAGEAAAGEAAAGEAAAGELVLNTVNGTITDTTPALVTAGDVTLGRGALDWLVPQKPGPLLNLARNGDAVGLDPSAVGSTLLGFAISGLVTPSLQPGGSTSLPFNIPMPAPISGVIGGPPTSDITLDASNAIPGGLSFSKNAFTLGVPDGVNLGVASINPFQITYDSDPDVFDGDVGLTLPVIDSSIMAHFQFQQGHFVEGDAKATFGNDFELYPDVFLAGLDLRVASPLVPTCSDPASLGGNVTVAVGPVDADGNGLFNVVGGASYTFPADTAPGVSPACAAPGVFSITGDAYLFPAFDGGIHVATAFVSYQTDGALSLGAQVTLGVPSLGVSGEVFGELNGSTHPVGFLLFGKVALSFGLPLAQADVAISNLGFGACAELKLPPVTIGEIEYVFGSGLEFVPGGCSLADLTPAGISLPAGFARSAAAGSAVVHVPRHDPLEGILVRSSSGVPLVRLAGPSGQSVAAPAASPGGSPTDATSSLAVSVTLPSEHSAWFVLRHPPAGAWRVVALAGSPAITSVQAATGLPAPALHVTVRPGPRGRFSLVYRSVPAPGRRVQFIEAYGDHVMHALGTVTGDAGRISFSPGAGRRGSREIDAIVTERGAIVEQLPVARYLAPGPPTLRAPRPVTVRRSGSRIVIRWGPVAAATRYVVRALLADGRALLYYAGPTARAITVPAVPGFDSATVLIAALGATGRPGPIATAKLRTLKPACLRPTADRGKLVCARTKPRHRHQGRQGVAV